MLSSERLSLNLQIVLAAERILNLLSSAAGIVWNGPTKRILSARRRDAIRHPNAEAAGVIRVLP